MPFVIVIVDALGGVLASILAVIGSMGAARILLLSWRLIRAIRASRS